MASTTLSFIDALRVHNIPTTCNKHHTLVETSQSLVESAQTFEVELSLGGVD